ncbi:hypothetical protein M8J76_013523 [Diaphorina citri]|nr:hypothetical protein M8J75_006989 [Diaphorina citri]KAI5749399.1 hypothetical protein M8J76_007045 [Diaphorina citri]KAI5750182.1 hypothetical protein M8J76_013523 [Diaphorina citri]KAI5756316.1 hypothetical protein M8J77_023986 [Diaphorina citri]
MFCEKALELIQELDRVKDSLPPYDTDSVRIILEEMNMLYEENVNVINTSVGEIGEEMSALRLRHAALERNKRCLLAYLWNRLQHVKQMRWEFGSILPPDIKNNLSDSEVEWFTQYNRNLAVYMKSIGSDGLNLALDMKPPKSLYLEVRCVQDHGKLEMDDGEVLYLKKNNQYLMARSQCEPLIRQGILEQIVR